MPNIIPGILEKEEKEIEEKLSIVKDFSENVHIDFIDGKFVQNNTFFDFQFFKKYKEDLILEAHLMVNEPINYLLDLSDSGFKRFAGHVEKMSSQEEFVGLAQTLGEVGLALDLDSPLDLIKIPFEDLDYILLLGVKAGFSNQEFDSKVLEKIKAAKEKGVIVEVDGGINKETLRLCLDAGADRFVSTKYIFSGDPQENYRSLTSL